MRAVIQRVSNASVTVDKIIVGKIDKGLLVFLGVGEEDNDKDVEYMVNKIVGLRVFQDENDKMNLSLTDVTFGHFSIYTLWRCKKREKTKFFYFCKARYWRKAIRKICSNDQGSRN